MKNDAGVRVSTPTAALRGVGRLMRRVPTSATEWADKTGALFWYRLEYSRFQDPAPSLSLGWAEDSDLANTSLLGLAHGDIEIRDRDRPAILVARQVVGGEASDQEASFVARTVDWITVVEGESECDFTLIAELSNRGLLEPCGIRNFVADGTVERFGKRRSFSGLKWTCEGGREYTLRLEFDSAPATGELGLRGDVLLARPRAVAEFRAPASLDIPSLLDEFEDELANVLTLLSVLSRRPIWWQRLRVISVDRQSGFRAESFRLSGDEPREQPDNQRRWPLVNSFSLAEGRAFESLIGMLRKAPERDSLLRAGSFLAASYGERTWEAAFVLAIAGLEALISGQEETYPSGLRPSNSTTDRVCDRVKDALRGFAGDDGLSAEQLEAVLRKVPELRRPPIKDVLKHHVERVGIAVEELWRAHGGLAAGISETFEQRNALLHAAEIRHPEEAFGNLARSRVLVERLLLRSLQLPDTLLHPVHDEDARRANLETEMRKDPSRYPIEGWSLVPKDRQGPYWRDPSRNQSST